MQSERLGKFRKISESDLTEIWRKLRKLLRLQKLQGYRSRGPEKIRGILWKYFKVLQQKILRILSKYVIFIAIDSGDFAYMCKNYTERNGIFSPKTVQKWREGKPGMY